MMRFIRIEWAWVENVRKKVNGCPIKFKLDDQNLLTRVYLENVTTMLALCCTESVGVNNQIFFLGIEKKLENVDI